MMRKFISDFVLRGLISGGFGPLAYGIIILVLQLSGVEAISDGLSIFKSIFSTYLLAFLIGGISVIWRVERIGLGFLILIHGFVLYVSYLIVYLLNDWVKKELIPFLVFTGIFILGYLLIWLIIYLVEKSRAKRLTKKFKSIKINK